MQICNLKRDFIYSRRAKAYRKNETKNYYVKVHCEYCGNLCLIRKESSYGFCDRSCAIANQHKMEQLNVKRENHHNWKGGINSDKKHVKQIKREYRKNNKDKIRKYNSEWYLSRGKEWFKEWRNKNREKLNTNQRLKRYGRPINKKGARAEALKLGYKSMGEVEMHGDLLQRGINALYESDKIDWLEKPKKYTPDFKVFREDGSFFYVELKGWLRPANRSMHLQIKKQHPAIDIRFVFYNCSTKLGKGSTTTYSMWCEKHGFLYAEKVIPDEWLQEEKNNGRTTV